MSKIGRNDPCPCGSGRKYKHCCIGGPIQKRRRSKDAPDVSEAFEEVEYPPEQFMQDMHAIAYYRERSGPARKPRFTLIDEEEGTSENYEINTDKPEARAMGWWTDQYDDFDEALGYMSVFHAVTQALRENRRRLEEGGLMKENSDGFQLHDTLIEELLQVTRLTDGEDLWLDQAEVDRIIDEGTQALAES